MRPVFALRDVALRFGSGAQSLLALQGVSLQIAPGERVALIGANGCGKSSLLRVLHGLLQPSAGRRESDASLAQAMVFQRPYLMRLSVQRNVALALWLRGQTWRAAQAAALEALRRVDLADQASRPAQALSGGQQQRVALARAWALQPQVLLLDEPTASLDPHAKREVENLIQQFATQQAQLTVVFASHNLGQVKRLATRVVYLEQGCVRADLPVEEFFGSSDLPTRYPQAHAFIKGDLS